MLNRITILWLVVVLLLAAGCQAGTDGGPSLEETAAPGATALPAPDATDTPSAEETFPAEPAETEGTPSPEEAAPAGEKEETMTPTSPSGREGLPQVRMAVTDLAGRLDVEAGEIEVVGVELVTWPDGSLGCPQPGMAYTQVPQDGLLIRLQVDDETYAYHSGETRDPFLCEEMEGFEEGGQKSTPVFGEGVLTRPNSEDE